MNYYKNGNRYNYRNIWSESLTVKAQCRFLTYSGFRKIKDNTQLELLSNALFKR